MKILMLVNWKIKYCKEKPGDKQPPDYYINGEDYWFYRYFREKTEVDVIDISSFPWLEHFEKEKIRFYIWQTLKAIPRLGRYDLIVSHGMQSGVVLSLWRRLFKTKAKHIVFEIGSFNSAAESGVALKLMQFASKSIDGLIYHTGSQIDYYGKFFPWLVKKSRFLRFGTDLDFYNPASLSATADQDSYILCVGYAKRDWDTLVTAYRQLKTDAVLRMIGHVDEKYRNISGVEQVPFVPIRELIRQIYNARFCVLPLESFNYSYGQMTLLQQMALGKCVIAARVPSLVDYIEDEKTAVLYTPGDSEDLARKMALLDRNPDLRDNIADAGKRWLQDSCNEKIMAREIEAFLRQVMEGRLQ